MGLNFISLEPNIPLHHQRGHTIYGRRLHAPTMPNLLELRNHSSLVCSSGMARNEAQSERNGILMVPNKVRCDLEHLSISAWLAKEAGLVWRLPRFHSLEYMELGALPSGSNPFPVSSLARVVTAWRREVKVTATVIAITQTGQKGGLRGKMDSKGNHSGLANRTLCRCLRPRLAMYLDTHVCLNNSDRDSQDSCRV
jgi:hypothetical protein